MATPTITFQTVTLGGARVEGLFFKVILSTMQKTERYALLVLQSKTSVQIVPVGTIVDGDCPVSVLAEVPAQKIRSLARDFLLRGVRTDEEGRLIEEVFAGIAERAERSFDGED